MTLDKDFSIYMILVTDLIVALELKEKEKGLSSNLDSDFEIKRSVPRDISIGRYRPRTR